MRMRGYDARCIRDISKRLRESVKTISSYVSIDDTFSTIVFQGLRFSLISQEFRIQS